MIKSLNLLLLCCLLSGACAHKAPAPQLPGFPEAESPRAAPEEGDVPATSTAAAAGEAAVLTETEISDLEAGARAGTEIYISSAPPEPPAAVNLGGNGKLTITRYDNGEKLSVTYRDKKGEYDKKALAKINRVMRCSLDDTETEIAVKLVELLDAVEDKFGKKGITLLSGFRSQKLNGTLKGAAEHSLHMLGWAADIRVQGYSSTKIKNFALKKKAGGVGYYPDMGFTHLDVGKSRYWVVKRPHKRRAHRRKISAKAATKAKKSVKSPKPAAKKTVRKK